MDFYEPGSESDSGLVNTESVGAMILNFPTFKTVLKELPLFISHLVYDGVLL